MQKNNILPLVAISCKKVYSSRSFEDNEAKQEYPFKDIYKLISFYRLKNPARFKSFNILEAESRVSNRRDLFDELHGHRLYASVTFVISRGLIFYKQPEINAWKFWHIYRHDSVSLDDIAKNFNFSKRTLQRRFVQMRESIEAIAMARELIPPKEL